MRISQSFNSYNQRRYSRPWIAKITSWEIGKQPDIEWGRFIGDDGGGEVEIEAMPGDIIRTGQKDHRGNNTDASWYIVDDSGNLQSCTAKEARKAWENKRVEPKVVEYLSFVDDAQLIAEMKRRKLTI